MRGKDLRAIISAAIRQFKAKLGRAIQTDAGTAVLKRWQEILVQARESSLTTQNWLWAPPARHSRRQIDGPLERIEVSYQLDVQHHLRDQPDDLLRRYARRLASRPPSAGRADLYRKLLTSVGALANDTTVPDSEVRERLRSLIAQHQQLKPLTRAQR